MGRAVLLGDAVDDTVVTSAVDDAEGSHPAAPSATTNVRVAMPTNGLLTPDRPHLSSPANSQSRTQHESRWSRPRGSVDVDVDSLPGPEGAL